MQDKCVDGDDAIFRHIVMMLIKIMMMLMIMMAMTMTRMSRTHGDVDVDEMKGYSIVSMVVAFATSLSLSNAVSISRCTWIALRIGSTACAHRFKVAV